MTTDLEKTFFDTFEIESKKGCTAYDKLEEHEADVICNDECSECLYFDDVYPCITDRILLELICIISSNPISVLFEPMLSGIKEVELLKNSILLTCIANEDVIKHQVRTLFEEG